MVAVWRSQNPKLWLGGMANSWEESGSLWMLSNFISRNFKSTLYQSNQISRKGISLPGRQPRGINIDKDADHPIIQNKNRNSPHVSQLLSHTSPWNISQPPKAMKPWWHTVTQMQLWYMMLKSHSKEHTKGTLSMMHGCERFRTGAMERMQCLQGAGRGGNGKWLLIRGGFH